MTKTIFCIGNGPSLRDFDFALLEGFDTIGMNAAYRHWDRIGWYPTYYCCLDDQLILTHHIEIIRLVSTGQVKGAFLHGSFFTLHPELVGDSRYWSGDQFNQHWHKERGAPLGFKFTESIAFRTGDTSRVTTGAYAVRFCAHLGYDKVALLGIDLKYVEVIPEAKATGDVTLEITSTPKENPNYFFDDYQQAGDKYNVPNPSAHDGDLHTRAFRVLRDDFFNAEIDCKIVNCNELSLLQKEAIFPFQPVESVTGKSLLGAIVVPCTPGEKDQILANFQLWAQPGFAPVLGGGKCHKPRLVFVFNRMVGGHREEITAAYRLHSMDRFFSGVEVHSLGLVGEADAYVRSYDLPSGEQGYKAGPNNQFFKTMRLAKAYGRYAFLMETDCVPVRPDWLRRLIELVDGAEPFFILGSAYRGSATLSKSFSRHINGNAVYAVGDPAFVEFMDSFWEPSMRSLVSKEDRRLAYDCILEHLLSSNETASPEDQNWTRWQSVAHKLRHTDFIQNISGDVDNATADADMIRNLLVNNRDTYIVHSQPVASAARNLVSSDSYIEPTALNPSPLAVKKVAPLSHSGFRLTGFTAVGAVERKDDMFHMASGSGSNYVMCRFSGGVKAKDRVTGRVHLTLPEPADLSVSVSRDGNGPFESSRHVGKFAAGAHQINVDHTFKNSFTAARIQIGVDGAPAAVEIKSALIEKHPPQADRDAFEAFKTALAKVV